MSSGQVSSGNSRRVAAFAVGVVVVAAVFVAAGPVVTLAVVGVLLAAIAVTGGVVMGYPAVRAFVSDDETIQRAVDARGSGD